MLSSERFVRELSDDCMFPRHDVQRFAFELMAVSYGFDQPLKNQWIDRILQRIREVVSEGFTMIENFSIARTVSTRN